MLFRSAWVVSGSGAACFESPVARGDDSREESARGVAYCAIGVAGASPEPRWRQRGVMLAPAPPLSLADLQVPAASLTVASRAVTAWLGRPVSDLARVPFCSLFCFNQINHRSNACLLLTLKCNLKFESAKILLHRGKGTFCEPHPTCGSSVGPIDLKCQVFCHHLSETIKWTYLEKYKSNGSESNCIGKLMKMPN